MVGAPALPGAHMSRVGGGAPALLPTLFSTCMCGSLIRSRELLTASYVANSVKGVQQPEVTLS